MKVMVACPPIESTKGTPQLGQNRQFQWFKKHSVIYPMVPASAATLLKEKGYDVVWKDAIAERMTEQEFYSFFSKESPDIIAFETKTPVIKYLWQTVSKLKEISPKTKVALFGDHVTALPEESMINSKADYILTGGDYDFLLLNLCNHLAKNEKLEQGIWFRNGKQIKNTGKFELNHDLNSLPFIDRELTKWELYAYNVGNYKYTPGTYVMAGRDCWWGKCKFCSWPTLYPCFRVRKPENLVDEIDFLVKNYNIKEIMDDTGSFPVGDWLKEFCNLMISRGLNKKVRISCNMRFGVLSYDDYKLMAEAGFRFILYGLESANQKTLDEINKGIKVNDIIEGCKMAKKAGLDPHITCMIGYPWESYSDAKKTLDLAKYLFNKGFVDTLQATIVVPYPKTGLYQQCKKNKWLKYDNIDGWEHYDMRENVMISKLSGNEIKELTSGLYKIYFSPRYMLRKITSIRNIADVRFVIRGVFGVFKHLADFNGDK